MTHENAMSTAGTERTCETDGCRRNVAGRAEWSSGGIDGEPVDKWLCDPCLSVAEEVVLSSPSVFSSARLRSLDTAMERGEGQ